VGGGDRRRLGQSALPHKEKIDVGGDRVLVRGEWGGEGASSGIEMYSSLTGIFTMCDGKISRVEYLFDHALALKAVGL
jgi:hypothetical protein